MYAKIFESIYDGSLRKDWKALVTFQQLLVLCDEGGFIDKTSDAISSRTTIPIDIIEHGLRELSSPDLDSRSQECEGRRIVLINPARRWGWKIVNYAAYRDIRSKEDLRQYWADQKRSQRQEKVSDRITTLKQKLADAYKRGRNDPWSYEEECLLLDISKRENCILEFSELIAYRPKKGKYFPHSIPRLLNTWAQTLDAARNGHSQMEDPKFLMKTIEDEIKIHPANWEYCGHNPNCSPEQKANLKQLREKLKTLRSQIANVSLNA